MRKTTVFYRFVACEECDGMGFVWKKTSEGPIEAHRKAICPCCVGFKVQQKVMTTAEVLTALEAS